MARKLGYFGNNARKKMFDVSRYGTKRWQKTHWMDENLSTGLNATGSTKAAQDQRQWWSTRTLIMATRLI